MKKFFFCLSLLFSYSLFAQQGDTVFLKRTSTDIPYPFYHAIFVDTTSAVRDKLTSFNFLQFDSATYFEQLSALRPLKKYPSALLKSFPRKWIALYKWKSNYYLYDPSDFGNHMKIEINDTTMTDYTIEGPQPSSIKKIRRPSDTRLLIERANAWKGSRVQVQLIDRSKGIAVFSFGRTKYGKGYQVLMVDAAKAHLFPTIVNYCETDKQGEFDFEKPKFASQLNTTKGKRK